MAFVPLDLNIKQAASHNFVYVLLISQKNDSLDT